MRRAIGIVRRKLARNVTWTCVSGMNCGRKERLETDGESHHTIQQITPRPGVGQNPVGRGVYRLYDERDTTLNPDWEVWSDLVRVIKTCNFPRLQPLLLLSTQPAFD